jgi:DNA-binding IclR family transcriptional regulator
MTEDQAHVLSAMAGARALTCGEIALAAEMPSETAWFGLDQLERAGLVRRLTNSPGRPTHWVRTDLLEGLT